jgi:hypothetical protein
LSVIDYTHHGKNVKAMQVGEYVFCGCCGEGENARHVVIHLESGVRFMCGLTQEQAALIADTLSLYGDESTASEYYEYSSNVQRIEEWANELSVEDTKLTYREWHKAKYSRLPELPKLPPLPKFG